MNQAAQTTLLAARDLGVAMALFRNSLAKSLGLNLTESLCLTLLGVQDGLTPTKLARLTGLTTGACTTMLDRLEAKGYLRRLPNPRDRRGVLVELTDAYRVAGRGQVAGVQAAHRALIESFSDAQLAVVADFLNRFTRNLADHSPDVAAVFPPASPGAAISPVPDPGE